MALPLNADETLPFCSAHQPIGWPTASPRLQPALLWHRSSTTTTATAAPHQPPTPTTRTRHLAGAGGLSPPCPHTPRSRQLRQPRPWPVPLLLLPRRTVGRSGSSGGPALAQARPLRLAQQQQQQQGRPPRAKSVSGRQQQLQSRPLWARRLPAAAGGLGSQALAASGRSRLGAVRRTARTTRRPHGQRSASCPSAGTRRPPLLLLLLLQGRPASSAGRATGGRRRRARRRRTIPSAPAATGRR